MEAPGNDPDLYRPDLFSGLILVLTGLVVVAELAWVVILTLGS